MVKITGESVDMMCKVRPEYKKYVAREVKQSIILTTNKSVIRMHAIGIALI